MGGRGEGGEEGGRRVLHLCDQLLGGREKVSSPGCVLTLYCLQLNCRSLSQRSPES